MASDDLGVPGALSAARLPRPDDVNMRASDSPAFGHRTTVRSLVLCLVLVASTTTLFAQAPAARESTPNVDGLPVIEVPPAAGTATTLVIVLTGDGGWADIDKSMARVFSTSGMAVVGLNARAYLSPAKTPAQSAADVGRIARYYAAKWHTRRLVLVGYSRGAMMAPFVVNRLDQEVRSQLVLTAMLGLPITANFQFHLIDLVRDSKREEDIAVMPELERMRGLRMLCVYGTQVQDSACRSADAALLTRVAIEGDHHFDRNYDALARLILREIPE